MKIAFIFPGQGSQFIGMGKELHEAFPEAKEVFEEVNDTLGQNLSRLMFTGEIQELTKTSNAQPAIMATSVAAARVINRQLGIDLAKASYFTAGHSLGEYSALLVLGVITLKQASRLLRVRGCSMQAAAEKHEGGMVALLGVRIEDAEKLAYEASRLGVCQVANDNGADQIVLSGEVKAIDQVIELAKNYPIRKAIRLNVSGAFHSELMKYAEEEMLGALDAETFSTPQSPIVCNVTAQPTTDVKLIKELLHKQICNRVRWRETMELFGNEGVSHIVEVGPGKVLAGIAKKMLPNTHVTSFSSPEELEALAKFLGK